MLDLCCRDKHLRTETWRQKGTFWLRNLDVSVRDWLQNLEPTVGQTLWQGEFPRSRSLHSSWEMERKAQGTRDIFPGTSQMVHSATSLYLLVPTTSQLCHPIIQKKKKNQGIGPCIMSNSFNIQLLPTSISAHNQGPNHKLSIDITNSTTNTQWHKQIS